MKNTKQYGKGSKRRQENFKLIQKNWDKINWGKKCDCHKYDKQVCDICQNWHDGVKDKK